MTNSATLQQSRDVALASLQMGFAIANLSRYPNESEASVRRTGMRDVLLHTCSRFNQTQR